MKEGGAKTKNVRVLAERLFLVENSFKGNAEAQEVANDILAAFKSVYEQNKGTISKSETVDLIVRSFARIHEESN